MRGIHLPDDDRKIQGNARLGCLYLEKLYRHSIWHVVEIRRDKWMRWSKKFDSRQSVRLRLMSGLHTEGGVGDRNLLEKAG